MPTADLAAQHQTKALVKVWAGPAWPTVTALRHRTYSDTVAGRLLAHRWPDELPAAATMTLEIREWCKHCKKSNNVLPIRKWPDASCSLTRWQQFSAWNDVIAASLKYDIISEIWLRQLTSIYLRNNQSNFIPVWFEMKQSWVFWRGCPNKNNNKNKISSKMRSGPIKKPAAAILIGSSWSPT